MNVVLILLYLCIIHLIFPHNANGIKSERKLYNQKLEGFSLQIYYGISWSKCIEICKSIRNCKSVNFNRFKSGLCQLNTEDETITLTEGLGYMFSSKSDWGYIQPTECSQCPDTESCNTSAETNHCTIIGCPKLDQLSGTTILGNFFHIGAKRLYKCDDGGEQEVRTCQQDGTWSPISLSCSTATCAHPEIENASVNVTQNADGATVAAISCNPGFFHQDVNEIQCNCDTLEWDNIEDVGCIEITVDSWTKIYRTISTVKANNVIFSWKQDGKQDTGEFRNDEIVSYWEESSFDSVKVEFIDSEDDTIRYLLFNRTDTDSMDWFSQDKVIDSSWTDLSGTGDEVRFFSITGVKLHNTGYLRWAILNAEDDDKEAINCVSDLVWFAIAKSGNYPCTRDRELPNRVIVYSKSRTGTTWEGGQLGFAKEVIVSVHVN